MSKSAHKSLENEPIREYIRLMKYNWQQAQWPEFKYNVSGLEKDLFCFVDLSGQVSGVLKGLDDDVQWETIVDMMIAEAIKSSEIEGEYLSRPDVTSSIRKCLGLQSDINDVRDPASQGIAELMVDSRNHWMDDLSQEKLFEWHRMLMKGTSRIEVGGWRTHAEDMQVVSSAAAGTQKVLYTASPSVRVPVLMDSFINWFNASVGESPLGPVYAAIAHLYFESIHPFEDGNGRIGRVLAEKALSRGLGRPVLLSLSRTINAHRSEYYAMLGEAQCTLEVTPWVKWVVKIVLEAQRNTYDLVNFSLKKTKFFDRYASDLNQRQLRVIQRMLKEGLTGFEGGMNAKKYMALTKVSKATATRDLQELVEKKIFSPIGDGRSTRYELVL